MKKAKPNDDEMRAEYRREDLGPLIRGKYATATAVKRPSTRAPRKRAAG